jgi:hypothetical protein
MTTRRTKSCWNKLLRIVLEGAKAIEVVHSSVLKKQEK